QAGAHGEARRSMSGTAPTGFLEATYPAGYALWHDRHRAHGSGLPLRPHLVSVLRAWKCACAHLLGIACDGGLDTRPEIAVALDEFGHPRREAQHVLQHQDLAIAGRARADADGRDRDLLRDTSSELFVQRLHHHRESASL